MHKTSSSKQFATERRREPLDWKVSFILKDTLSTQEIRSFHRIRIDLQGLQFDANQLQRRIQGFGANRSIDSPLKTGCIGRKFFHVTLWKIHWIP